MPGRLRAAALACADCGLLQLVPELPARHVAECARCDRMLDRTAATSLRLSLVAATLELALLVPAALLPMLGSTIRNLVFAETQLISSVPVIYRDVWWPFAAGFFLFAILFPGLRALLHVLVVASVLWRLPVPGAGRLLRWNQELRLWSMTDVVVIAGVLTYYRASIPADVEVLAGAWCYVAVAALALVADRALDLRALWNAILPDATTVAGDRYVACGLCELAVRDAVAGERCPRCGATIGRDVARRFLPTVVVLAAALPLVVPAYLYSVLVNETLTGMWEYSVLGTVQLIADSGYVGFALILLVTGVVLPALVLGGLVWLLLRVWFPSRLGLVPRTRAYRVLHALVRWPMVIPFLAATASPIVSFPGLDDIVAGPGSTPFFLYITLLMLALRLFEPRLMWQAAEAA